MAAKKKKKIKNIVGNKTFCLTKAEENKIL
jgi:hypothetical protein